MKKLVLVFLSAMSVLAVSCDDALKSLNVKENVSMPVFEFRIARAQQKADAPDTLLDETFRLNLDSMMSEWGYSSVDVAKYLKKSTMKTVTFQLKDSAQVKQFDFIDSARLTFATAYLPEVTVARLNPRVERESGAKLTLSIALEDVTNYILSKESIRVRIYGKTHPELLPEGVSYTDVLVGGILQMELTPAL